MQSLYQAINGRDWRTVRLTLHPDFQRISDAAGGQSEDAEDFIHVLRAQCAAFENGSEEIEDIMGEDDKVAARILFSGKQTGALGDLPASGRALRLHYIAIFRIAENRVIQMWAEWDNVAALQSLGH
ncbi:MAG: ester cyclase [Leptospiraceae bacterium]|nr:ester cyclase [Leptospiraceae bacterium]